MRAAGLTSPGRCIRRAAVVQQRDAGFTLLEVLVAMVVLALIMTSAFGALRLGERSWEAGHTRATETETMRSVAGALQRQFKQILPLTWTDDNQTTLAFNGDLDRLRYIAPAPIHHGATGLYEYSLVVESDADNSRLVLYYRLHDPDTNGFGPDGGDRQRVLLVDRLKTASFAFFGSPVEEDPAQWHSQWSNEADAYPLMVQLRLGSPSEQQPWPDLFLAMPTVQTQ